jgi:hypothetical protein
VREFVHAEIFMMVVVVVGVGVTRTALVGAAIVLVQLLLEGSVLSLASAALSLSVAALVLAASFRATGARALLIA